MRIWETEWGAKIRTDDEYVASVREWVKYPKRTAVVNAGWTLFFIGASLAWALLGVGLIARIGDSRDLSWELFGAGMLIAMHAGFILGLSAWLPALRSRSQSPGSLRTQRLALAFYDELKNKTDRRVTDTVETAECAKADGRRILGLTVSPKRMTDEQYVASIRKLARWTPVVEIVALVLSFVCAAAWLMLLRRLLGSGLFESTDRGWQGAAVGLLWGGVTGSILSFFFQPMGRLGVIFYGCRTEHLMLKCYDELNAGAGGREAAVLGTGQ
jgi:hypothetical protein